MRFIYYGIHWHVLSKAEMVLIKDNQIPIRGMYKFILSLDTSAFIGTK